MQQRGETDFALFHLSVAVPGLEPRLREPESRVLPLHHTAEKKIVAPPRLELSQTEPKSGVLPLHHGAISQSDSSDYCFASAKIKLFFELSK